ncbi:hypothetical protein Amal_03984 [Acetobacter malorum]|uniref:Uncharacterized protein n=1 Tax=Acetobacter malorum TaxID=178901 RepID=A0A177G164_9PROT|nr:hypothetical protein Amal_03984 [Acetobacter malorum]
MRGGSSILSQNPPRGGGWGTVASAPVGVVWALDGLRTTSESRAGMVSCETLISCACGVVWRATDGTASPVLCAWAATGSTRTARSAPAGASQRHPVDRPLEKQNRVRAERRRATGAPALRANRWFMTEHSEKRESEVSNKAVRPERRGPYAWARKERESVSRSRTALRCAGVSNGARWHRCPPFCVGRKTGRGRGKDEPEPGKQSISMRHDLMTS